MRSELGGKTIVTGASGWLGTEYLESLLLDLGSEKLTNSVVCLGSTRRPKYLSDGTELTIEKMGEFEITGPVSGILHLAFLTRDKVAHMSPADYSHANLSITSQAVRLIERYKPNWVASVSSGAVVSSPGGPLENSLENNPYGFTKRIEETLLREVCGATGSNLAIGRLWGAMGSHMPINRAYAISDFIMQALETSTIQVKAGHEVFRRYCLASDFMAVLTGVAKNHPLTIFDSGGSLIELGALAAKIADQLSVPLLARPLIAGKPADTYFPDSNRYELIAAEMNVSLANIDEQMRAVLRSHSAATV